MTPLADLGGPHGDLLGLIRLQGEALPPGKDRRAILEMRMRLAPEAELEIQLREARGRGWRGLVALGNPRLLAALKRAGRAAPAPLPIVPNLQGFMREAVEHGMVGAGIRRARRVGILGLAGLGLRSVARAPLILRRDFPTMLRSFVELELSEWSRLEPPVIFLQEQMTDLALAMDNPRIVAAFAEAVRRRTGARVGLVTNNLGRLGAALGSWGIQPDAILTPWDVAGLRLRPDPESCRQAVKMLGAKVWGLRRDWTHEPSSIERAAFDDAGLSGAVREDLGAWGEKP